MFKKLSIVYLSKFAIICAAIYSIAVLFFLRAESFTGIWILYVGNALFLIAVFLFGMRYGKTENAPPKKFNGFTLAILGTFYSCIFILILTLIFAPDVFDISNSGGVLQNTPPAITKTNEHGLLFIILANALVGNFIAGCFAAVMARGKNAEKKLPS